MRAFLISIIKKLGYIVAAAIIIAAIFVSLARVFSPVLDEHKPDFEKWASVLLDMPVSISQVRMSWNDYQPGVDLNDVTILSKNTQQPVLHIQTIRVYLSILKSIWKHQFVPDEIMISGTTINIHESATGEFTIQGFPSLTNIKNQAYQNETKLLDIVGWLSLQSQLSLRNINIHYLPQHGAENFITLYHLTLHNALPEHHLSGKAILNQEIPTEINLRIDWEGNKPDLAQIKAKIYIYMTGFSLAQWLHGYTWEAWNIKQGILSAEYWASWNHNTFQKIQSTFQLYQLKLYSHNNNQLHTINRISGNIGWKREGQTQVIAGNDVLIDLPNHLWPVTSFYFAYGEDQQQHVIPKSLNIGYLDLHDLYPFISSSLLFSSNALQQIMMHVQPQATLENTVIGFPASWNDWDHIVINTHFNKLHLGAWENIPEIQNLSGSLKWSNAEGTLLLNSHDFIFADKHIFIQPIMLDRLSGAIDIQQQNKQWQLHIPSLQLKNKDAEATVNGNIIFQDHLPQIDIHADFNLTQANHVTRYLPMQTFSKYLSSWLREAFLSGSVHSGTVTLRGNLADFPFDQPKQIELPASTIQKTPTTKITPSPTTLTQKNNTDAFIISGLIDHVNFKFAPDWPILENVTGKLIFTGRKMAANITGAMINHIPIHQVTGVIPDLGDEHAAVQVQSSVIAMDLAQGLKFIHHSPLEKIIGQFFTSIDITGPGKLTLGLTIPINNPDKTAVKGMIDINHAKVNLVPWNLFINQVQGQFQFTERTVSSNKMQGLLFNKPLTFQLQTETKKNHPNTSTVQTQFNSELALNDLSKWLNIPISSAQGSTQVNGTVDFSMTKPLAIHLSSNLVGITINATDPFNKKNTDIKNFTADIYVPGKEPLRLKLNYNKLMSAALILDHTQEKYHVIGAQLNLGKQEASWPVSNGLYITGDFDQLDWDTIKNYFNQSNNTQFSGLNLRSIDIRTRLLTMFGQQLSRVQCRITPDNNMWRVNIQSNDIVGDLTIPKNMNSHGMITADLKKLNLNAVPTKNETNHYQKTSIDLSDFPELSIKIAQAYYKNMLLGQVNLETAPSAEGLIIRRLTMSSSFMNLSATGSWMKNSHSQLSHLTGSVRSREVSELLKNFGYDVHNFVAYQGNLSFNFNWRDAPYAPSLAGLNGDARLSLGEGRIVDIGSQESAQMDLGKMLSIFSLQSIPRRLTLDFSDVFQKGYSFNSVRGDFNFQNGDAYTKSLQFDGPVARVAINGKIGLANKNFDLALNITPYVTSSLPVAATFLGGPWVGLAAFAVNAVVSSQVSKVSTYNYHVTGPWNNPQWISSGNRNRK